MTRRSQRPRKNAVFAAAALALLGGAFAISCSSKTDESKVSPCANQVDCGATCTATSGCGTGKYCGGDGKCTADCIPGDGRCAGGQMCGPSGKCQGGLVVDSGTGTGDGDGGPGEPADGCVKVDVKFTKEIPTVVMLIDQSGSMNAKFDMGNRWNVLRDALIAPATGIISTLQAEVRFGLALYTSQNGYGMSEPKKTCPIITEVPPALNNFMAISDKYLPNDWAPNGDTPTGESVDAAVKILQGVTDPGPKVIVLATDGEPDSCTDPDPDQGSPGAEAARQVSVTAVTNAFQAQVTTFVISVGDEVGEAHLRAVANAGQGLAVDVDQMNRFYRANSQADLKTAFDSIVNGVRSCVLALNGTVNLTEASQGTVQLDGKPLTYNDPNGWKLNSPTLLELTGTACETIKSGDHAIAIDFPCGVIVPIVPK